MKKIDELLMYQKDINNKINKYYEKNLHAILNFDLNDLKEVYDFGFFLKPCFFQDIQKIKNNKITHNINQSTIDYFEYFLDYLVDNNKNFYSEDRLVCPINYINIFNKISNNKDFNILFFKFFSKIKQNLNLGTPHNHTFFDFCFSNYLQKKLDLNLEETINLNIFLFSTNIFYNNYNSQFKKIGLENILELEEYKDVPLYLYNYVLDTVSTLPLEQQILLFSDNENINNIIEKSKNNPKQYFQLYTILAKEKPESFCYLLENKKINISDFLSSEQNILYNQIYSKSVTEENYQDKIKMTNILFNKIEPNQILIIIKTRLHKLKLENKELDNKFNHDLITNFLSLNIPLDDKIHILEKSIEKRNPTDFGTYIEKTIQFLRLEDKINQINNIDDTKKTIKKI